MVDLVSEWEREERQQKEEERKERMERKESKEGEESTNRRIPARIRVKSKNFSCH